MKIKTTTGCLEQMRRSCLTREELAAVLQVGDKQIREWVWDGCPCINLQRKPVTAAYANLRFDLDKVLSWLKSFSAPIV